MKIVINISDEVYQRIKADKYMDKPEQAWDDITAAINAICNGVSVQELQKKIYERAKVSKKNGLLGRYYGVESALAMLEEYTEG